MLIEQRYVGAMARGIIGAVGDLDDVQKRFGRAMFEVVAGRPIRSEEREPLGPQELADTLLDADARQQFIHLLAVFELMVHPLPPALEHTTETYGRALGIDPPLLQATRDLTREHYVLAYLDLSRHSWYVEHTLIDSVHGKLFRRLRSEMAYFGLGDRHIAARWTALGELPEGTWGRAVDEFYERNGFARPGEPHGIYELGAWHDWVHVLTGYGTDPVGELKVFGFIAANMDDPRGFTMLAVTLGLFQTGTISHMHGKRVEIATVDALEAPGASEDFANAIVHGTRCSRDVMGGIDLFAWAERPLADVRAELGLPSGGFG